MARFATAALVLVGMIAAAQAQAAAKPKAAPAFAGRTATGAFCRHSCYTLPAKATCQSVVATKTAVLTAAKIPFKVDGSSCTPAVKASTGCDVLMLQSWPSKAQHDAYQIAEDKPALASMRKQLASTNPKAPWVKSGACAGFKSPIV
ncbi:MAG: hypothetical protein J3K34DRAFT_403771 [Monoraphidium minutum]|nr:MAG: hypothetical protein J3K34DRAFT_403771 [Monoraphidium minutum]